MTGSDIASIFDMLLKYAHLLNEADQEDDGLDTTVVDRKEDETNYGLSSSGDQEYKYG